MRILGTVDPPVENKHYRDMIDILLAHPKGVRVDCLARALYNKHCSLFDPDGATLYQRIHSAMYSHLWRNSRKPTAPFQRVRWGTYALSPYFVRQLEFCFEDWDEPMTNTRIQQKSKPPADPYAGMKSLF